MKMREGYMQCRVGPGPFYPEEYAIEIPMGEEGTACAWVWQSNVVGISGEIKTEKHSVEEIFSNWGKPDPDTAHGWARVIVMEEGPEGLLVTLPYDTMSGQRTFWVQPDMVEYNPV
jgi:hypothetical protein